MLSLATILSYWSAGFMGSLLVVVPLAGIHHLKTTAEVAADIRGS